MSKDLRDDVETQKYLISPIVLFGFILLIGVALRLFHLGTESYWIDEMSTVIEGYQSAGQLLASGRLDQPPAYYIPFHMWMELFGDTEISTRLFSVLAGIGSIVLIYIIGKTLFGNTVGLLSAFLMAISEFQIYHSQIARFYSFFELFTLISFLYFILALRTEKTIYFVIYGIASALMIYSHTYGLFILVAQNLFFFIQVWRHKNKIPIWIICQVGIGLALLPYLFPLLFGENGIKGAVELNITGLTPPTFLDPLHSIYRFIMTGRSGRDWGIFITNYVAAGVFLVVGVWSFYVRQGKEKISSKINHGIAALKEVTDLPYKLLMVSCWLIFPILLPFIASILLSPMYNHHYTISASPAFYLLLALGMVSFRRTIPLIISIGTLAILIIPGLSHYYTITQHEQWREVASYVEENSVKGDVVVFAPNMGIGIQEKSFDWYYQGNLQGCGLSSKLADSNAILSTLVDCLDGQNRFWVIIANYPNVTADERFKAFFLESKQLAISKLAERQFFGISVYLFEIIE